MQQFIFRKLGAKGSFSGMTTKFLATERLLKVFKKILKNTYFTHLKSSIFIFFLFSPFGPVEKRLTMKAMINFKIDDVKNWETNNYNIGFARHLMK